MKYELVKVAEHFRIRALKDFAGIKAGEYGGLVSGPDNLSQHGNCWIGYGASVIGQASVHDDAIVTGSAFVYDSAVLADHAIITDGGVLKGKARALGNATIMNSAYVEHDALITGNAALMNAASMHGSASIGDEAILAGSAWVSGKAQVRGQILLNGKAGLSAGKVVVPGVYENFATLSVGEYQVISFQSEEIAIGCRTFSYDTWMADGEKIGQAEGLTKSEIKRHLHALRFVRQMWAEGLSTKSLSMELYRDARARVNATRERIISALGGAKQ